MKWIILFTLISYVLVNSPLFYSLIYVHKPYGIGALWGYAPHQFLFLVVIFPFAAFAAFTSIYLFVFELYPVLPTTLSFKWLFDNWPAGLLVAISLTAMICTVIYFTSGWSFDKLRPEYATKTLSVIQTLENDVEQSSLKKEEQESFRRKGINAAKQATASLQLPESTDDETVSKWLDDLSPGIFLQVVQNPSLVTKLRLLNPAIHLLNIFQLFIVLLIGFCMLIIAGLTIAGAYQLKYDVSNYPQIGETLNAIFWTVFFFGWYSICYYQYRLQIESVVGTGTTVLQDVFTALIVTMILISIRLLDPSNREISQQAIISYLPIALLGVTGASGIIRPDLLKTLIGNETNAGTQIILSFLIFILSFIPLFRMLSRVQ